MLRRQALSLSAFLLASPLLAQIPSLPEQAPPPKPPAAGPSGSNADFERMRSLLQQMQMGLAYLPPGYSAMKHQFELQNEMWRIVLDRLERAA